MDPGPEKLSNSENPYAAPISDSPHAWRDAPGELFAQGKLLIAAKNADFPDRCVKCNAPAHGYRLKRVLYWHNPLYYLIILVCNVLIYAIVALIVRQKATFHVGLCEVHRAKRRNAMLVGWSCVLASVAVFVAAAAQELPYLFLLAAVLLLFGIIWGMLGSRIVYPKQIDETYAWLNGAGGEFLDSLGEESTPSASAKLV